VSNFRSKGVKERSQEGTWCFPCLTPRSVNRDRHLSASTTQFTQVLSTADYATPRWIANNLVTMNQKFSCAVHCCHTLYCRLCTPGWGRRLFIARGWDAGRRRMEPPLLFIFLVQGNGGWSLGWRRLPVSSSHRRPLEEGVEGRETHRWRRIAWLAWRGVMCWPPAITSGPYSVRESSSARPCRVSVHGVGWWKRRCRQTMAGGQGALLQRLRQHV